MTSVGRHSKLQKQVLSLYRMLLRASDSKPGVQQYVKEEFRRNSAAVNQKHVLHIESLLRRGQRYLEDMHHIDRVTFMKPED